MALLIGCSPRRNALPLESRGSFCEAFAALEKSFGRYCSCSAYPTSRSHISASAHHSHLSCQTPGMACRPDHDCHDHPHSNCTSIDICTSCPLTVNRKLYRPVYWSYGQHMYQSPILHWSDQLSLIQAYGIRPPAILDIWRSTVVFEGKTWLSLPGLGETLLPSPFYFPSIPWYRQMRLTPLPRTPFSPSFPAMRQS